MAIDPQLLQQLALGNMNMNPTGFNPETLRAQQPMPNPNFGGLGGRLRQAAIGMQNGLGRLGQGMFPINPTVAARMSAEEQKQMQQQAMLNMGLGIMGAAGQPGAKFGSSLARGVFGAQEGMLGQQQMSYQLGAQDREEKREEDRILEERQRYGREVKREDMLDTRALEQQGIENERADRAFNESTRQFGLGHGLNVDELALRGELGRGQLALGYASLGARMAQAQARAGKLTGEEQRALSYVQRMNNAETSMRELQYKPSGMGGTANMIASRAPMSELLTTEDFERYEASAREWIAGLLRYDSGAAVPEEEFRRYFKTWFAQPGNSDTVITDKEQKRAVATRSILTGLPPQAIEKLRAEGPEAFEEILSAGRREPMNTGGATGRWGNEVSPQAQAVMNKYLRQPQ